MLIGLTGSAQAGKDTTCERIGALMDSAPPFPLWRTAVERRAFADKLYESAAASLGVTTEWLREWKLRPESVIDMAPFGALTVREYLQRFGTEGHRDVFGPDFWASQLDLTHEGRCVVITDVRFENEARMIHEAGGWIWQVVGTVVSDVRHSSEAGLPADLIDWEVWNTERGDGFASLDRSIQRAFANWGYIV